MNKLIAVIFLCLPATLIAQRSAGIFMPAVSGIAASGASVRDVADTIYLPGFIAQNQGGLGCFTGIYSSTDSGYVTGNNAYGDLQKAQFFSLSHLGYYDSAKVTGVIVKTGLVVHTFEPEDLVANIYATDSTGLPVTLLATSLPTSMGDADADGILTFSFSTPVQVTDSFYISIQLPVFSGDTLVILSTQDHCVAYTGWAWEQWNDSTWHSILNSWILDVDMAIFPVVELPYNVVVAEVKTPDAALFPNPAQDMVNIHFRQPTAASQDVFLRDMSGKILFHDRIDGGSTSYLLQLNDVASGCYQLQLISGHQTTNRMLVVSKD